MAHGFMLSGQASRDSTWVLQEGTSTTLEIGPGPRVLQVCAGRVWLTSAGTETSAARDVWLLAGETVELPAGLHVVLEGWPSARFQLLVPPRACRRGRAAGLPARIGARLSDRLRTPTPGLQPSQP